MKIRADIEQMQLSIRKITEIARKKEGCIRFDIGQPDFDTPKHIKEAAAAALWAGKTDYGPISGIDEVREAIARYESKKGLAIEESNVIVTCGGMQALFITCLAHLEKGDEVIVPDPYWAAYNLIIKSAHGKVRPVHFTNNSSLDIDSLKRSITDRTKLLFINFPSNPTGEYLIDDDLKRIAQLAIEKDLVIVSDEVYERMLFSGKFTSIAKYAPENTIRINSFSKTYAMTGWRLGWLTAPKKTVEQLEKCSRAVIACPPTFLQYGGVAALESDQSCVEDMIQEYRKRYSVIKQRLDRLGWKYIEPKGTFYIFADVKKDSWPFCLEMIEWAGVSAVPGSAFGSFGKTYARFCFGSVSCQKIEEGFDRLERWLG